MRRRRRLTRILPRRSCGGQIRPWRLAFRRASGWRLPRGCANRWWTSLRCSSCWQHRSELKPPTVRLRTSQSRQQLLHLKEVHHRLAHPRGSRHPLARQPVVDFLKVQQLLAALTCTETDRRWLELAAVLPAAVAQLASEVPYMEAAMPSMALHRHLPVASNASVVQSIVLWEHLPVAFLLHRARALGEPVPLVLLKTADAWEHPSAVTPVCWSGRPPVRRPLVPHLG